MLDVKNMSPVLLIEAFKDRTTKIAGAAGTPSMADSRDAALLEEEILRRMAW